MTPYHRLICLLFVDFGAGVFRLERPIIFKSSIDTWDDSTIFQSNGLNSENDISNVRATGNGAQVCSRYSTQEALINLLRMRASFNPAIMSNTLNEAEHKIKDLLGTTGYTMVPLGRSGSGGFSGRPRMQDPTYFPRANAMASQELLRNVDLSLRKMCRSRQTREAVTANFSRPYQKVNRSRRDLLDPAKPAELDRIGVTRRQYCLNRGDDVNGLLRMCKMCASVTELPDIYFPRFINEIMCSSEDTGCLYAGTLPHGICQAKKLEVTVLERNTNHDCLEDWQPVTVGATVSCECFVHRSSFLRPFV